MPACRARFRVPDEQQTGADIGDSRIDLQPGIFAVVDCPHSFGGLVQVLRNFLDRNLVESFFFAVLHRYPTEPLLSVNAPTLYRARLACLSAALSWALEAGDIDRNVAMDVRRPHKSVRERLITDDEYLTVHDRAQPSVRLAMLAVRTLGLPADVLKMGPRNLIKLGGQYTLRFRRGKTGVQVEVEVVGELATALQPFIDERSLHPTFVRRDDGKPYTVDGVGAMRIRLRRIRSAS
jgi:hypothetical protein